MENMMKNAREGVSRLRVLTDEEVEKTKQIIEDVKELIKNDKFNVDFLQIAYTKGVRRGKVAFGVFIEPDETVFGWQLLALVNYAKSKNYCIELEGHVIQIIWNFPFDEP